MMSTLARLLPLTLLLSLLIAAPSHATTLISLDVSAFIKRSALLTTETTKQAARDNKRRRTPEDFCGNDQLPPARAGK